MQDTPSDCSAKVATETETKPVCALLCREDLDQYLATSGYGANVAMFNCYFIRDGPDTPPLCIACRRPIGEHPSRTGAPILPGLSHTAVGVAVATPKNMVVGGNVDTVDVPIHRGVVIAVVIIASLLVFEIIFFASIGIFASGGPIVCIGPCILFLVLLGFAWFSKSSRLVFHKDSPRHVVITERRLMGCRSTRSCATETLGQVCCRATRTRVNNAPLFEIVALAADGSSTVLHRGYYEECAPEFFAWQAYLMQYGIEPTGGMPPYMV